VAYPDALAEVLDAAEGKTTPKGGKKKGSVAYPAALARVIAMSEQESTTDGATASGKVAKYPSQLSRVLQAMDAGVQSTTPKTPTPKKAVDGKAARKSRATKSRVQYPAALKRYLDLAASASTMTAVQAPRKPAQATQKPKRASYPEVLANVLSLTEGTIARPSPKTAPAKSTAKTAANSKTRVNPPTAATYPPVLAQLLEAAKNTKNLDQVQEELQEAGAFLAKYPDALATYLDLVEMSTVPPSVPPPKRASYPVVLAEALGLGLNLNTLNLDTDLTSDDDITSQLLSEAQFSNDDTSDSAVTVSATTAVYPEALSTVLDASLASPKPLDESTVGYPAALADVLDLSANVLGGSEYAVAPAVAIYPAALADLLDLSAQSSSAATDDVPAAYPAALAELIFDASEASVESEASEESPRESGEQAEAESGGLSDIFAKFDKIAQRFGEKFGL